MNMAQAQNKITVLHILVICWTMSIGISGVIAKMGLVRMKEALSILLLCPVR